MKVKFILDTPLVKMGVMIDWNFPHLPRVGEIISPHVIMLQGKFTYMDVVPYMTDEGKRDFEQFISCNEEVEEKFRTWIYDVICESNIIESIHYAPSTEDYTTIIPIIYLSDK